MPTQKIIIEIEVERQGGQFRSNEDVKATVLSIVEEMIGDDLDVEGSTYTVTSTSEYVPASK